MIDKAYWSTKLADENRHSKLNAATINQLTANIANEPQK
jgi:hypothetical protein